MGRDLYNSETGVLLWCATFADCFFYDIVFLKSNTRHNIKGVLWWSLPHVVDYTDAQNTCNSVESEGSTPVAVRSHDYCYAGQSIVCIVTTRYIRIVLYEQI